jgi:PAS domain S-box-containing protein
MPVQSKKNIKYQVLCVDDEAPLLDICTVFLERSGEFRVTTALNASDGLQLLETNRYDAIVSDYQMPGKDGIQFLVEVRKRLGEIPFILFTGRGREEVVILAIDNGADFYVQKGGETKAQFAELAHKIRVAVTRRSAENQISESEKFLRTVIADAKEGIIVYDRDLHITLWNRFMEELTGLKAPDVLGKNSLELFPFHKENGIDMLLKQALDGTTVESPDFAFYIASTGNKGWARGVYSPNYDAHGKIIGVISIVRDVTERKQAVEALKESEKRYRDLFDLNNAVMVIVDPETGRIVDANAAASRYYGYSREEFSGITVMDLNITDTAVTRNNMAAILENKGAALNVKHQKKNGEIRDVMISSAPVTLGGKQLIHSIIQDVTERMLAEDALRQTNTKLNLLSSITRHDINFQITALMGYLSLLKNTRSDPPLNEYTEKASEAAQHISSIIQFTKEYDTIGIKTPVWQNLHNLVDIAAQQVPLTNITVKNDLPASAEVFADPLIVKVFYNLMNNAVRFGGRITTIRFFLEESGDKTVILCEDDGNGVPTQEKEKIFDKGYGKNSGLGLFLSREILSISGITIAETGEPGKGARFTMTVPKGAWRTGKTGA